MSTTVFFTAFNASRQDSGCGERERTEYVRRSWENPYLGGVDTKVVNQCCDYPCSRECQAKEAQIRGQKVRNSKVICDSHIDNLFDYPQIRPH